jgi:hypothetical protein
MMCMLPITVAASVVVWHYSEHRLAAATAAQPSGSASMCVYSALQTVHMYMYMCIVNTCYWHSVSQSLAWRFDLTV